MLNLRETRLLNHGLHRVVPASAPDRPDGANGAAVFVPPTIPSGQGNPVIHRGALSWGGNGHGSEQAGEIRVIYGYPSTPTGRRHAPTPWWKNTVGLSRSPARIMTPSRSTRELTAARASRVPGPGGFEPCREGGAPATSEYAHISLSALETCAPTDDFLRNRASRLGCRGRGNRAPTGSCPPEQHDPGTTAVRRSAHRERSPGASPRDLGGEVTVPGVLRRPEHPALPVLRRRDDGHADYPEIRTERTRRRS
jgi:hypothetical protein